MFFGNPEGLYACRKAQHVLDSGAYSVGSDQGAALVTSDEPATQNEIDVLSRAAKTDNEDIKHFILRTCVWCKRENDPVLEFLVRSPGIWLHALQYTVLIDNVSHSFRTSLPNWSLMGLSNN